MGGLKVLGLSFPVNVGMLEKHCSLISVVWFKVVVAECYGKEKMELLCMKRLRKALGHSGLGNYINIWEQKELVGGNGTEQFKEVRTHGEDE